MRQQDTVTLRKRAFTYKRKHRLIDQMQRRTNWSDKQIAEVIKHRRHLILAASGLHRANKDPVASHPQFIQTSLLADGWTSDHLMSALAWSHDMKDDFRETYDYYVNNGQYSSQMIHATDLMSRNPAWGSLPYRDEVEQSDLKLRSGGQRTMVLKILDRVHNDLNPLRNTSPNRLRKSLMKAWQSQHSLLPIAKEIGYMYEELLWLTDRQQKRLGYTGAELDKLVQRPLDNP